MKCGVLFAAECGDLLRQCAHATGAAFHQKLLPGRGGGEECTAAVVFVLFSCDQPLFFEGVNDARHRWRANLLGSGEIAEGDGASEDNDREGREAGGVKAAAFVFFSELS